MDYGRPAHEVINYFHSVLSRNSIKHISDLLVDGFHIKPLKVNLVEWLKMMVGTRRSEEVVDPNIEVRPPTRSLKRALLTALRCVDPDSEKRPKMSQVVRMLESEEYPIPREVSPLTSD